MVFLLLQNTAQVGIVPDSVVQSPLCFQQLFCHWDVQEELWWQLMCGMHKDWWLWDPSGEGAPACAPGLEECPIQVPQGIRETPPGYALLLLLLCVNED